MDETPSWPRIRAGTRQRIIAFESKTENYLKPKLQLGTRRSLSLTALLGVTPTSPPDFAARYRKFTSYLGFSFTYRLYMVKERLISIVENPEDISLFRNLSVGDSFEDFRSHIAQRMPPSDYSLFCRHPNIPLKPEVVNALRLCFTALFRRMNLPYDSTDRIMRSYRQLSDIAVPPDAGRRPLRHISYRLPDIRRNLQQLTRHLWPLIGNVVPHSLLRLFDPEDDFRGLSYSMLYAESKAILLDSTLDSIILFRLVNGHPIVADIPVLPLELAERSYGKNSTIRRKLELFQNGHLVESLGVRVRSPDNFVKLLSHSLNIYCIIRVGKTRDSLYKDIEAMYKVDSAAAQFLDWGEIADYIKRFPADSNPRSIFISTLMTDPVISRRFPLKVSLSLGTGRVNRQIFSLASHVSKTKRARNISTFLRLFLTLKQPARDLVFSYLSDKSVADRLYAVFQPGGTRLSHSTLDPASPRDDRQISETRIEIIRFVLEHCQGGRDYFLKQLSEENSLIRSFYFKDIYGQGRIHLNKIEILFELDMIMITDFDIDDLINQPREVVFRRHLANAIADSLVSHAVFNSDFSLESVLSNNLRHGVIEPRLLSSIDLACRLADDYDLVADLKHSVSLATQRYMGEWLTIHTEGPTFRRLREDVATKLSSLMAKDGQLDISTLAEATLEEVARAAGYVADNAQIAFTNQLVAEIEKLLTDFFTSRPVSIALQERLTDSFKSTFSEVRSWIGISNLEKTVENFSLRDLVEFELKLIQPQQNIDSAQDRF
ncbi:hypothetical protein NKI36_13885 [Mesorhizobium caraganae]|uniref:Lanthionine biosynthesis protein LanB n=1 Tax=Mesorhizobium caraganae TaxID=483206 RepID=A0ABV1YZJ1_9HYPH